MPATALTASDPGLTGIYPPRRAGALAGISGNALGQWARHGLVVPTVYEGRPHNLYSFRDVAEAIAVRWLLDQQFSHKKIREALASIPDRPLWPLQTATLGVARHSDRDGGVIVRRDPTNGIYLDANNQTVLAPWVWDQAQDMLRTGGWIAKAHQLTHIEVEPLKLGGEPTLRGRRWTLRQVANQGADEEGRRILRDNYGLADVEINEARTWVKVAAALA